MQLAMIITPGLAEEPKFDLGGHEKAHTHNAKVHDMKKKCPPEEESGKQWIKHCLTSAHNVPVCFG